VGGADRKETLAAIPARCEIGSIMIKAGIHLRLADLVRAKSCCRGGGVQSDLGAFVAFQVSSPGRVADLPIVAAFLVSLIHFVSSYRLRVGVCTAYVRRHGGV